MGPESLLFPIIYWYLYILSFIFFGPFCSFIILESQPTSIIINKICFYSIFFHILSGLFFSIVFSFQGLYLVNPFFHLPLSSPFPFELQGFLFCFFQILPFPLVSFSLLFISFFFFFFFLFSALLSLFCFFFSVFGAGILPRPINSMS